MEDIVLKIFEKIKKEGASFGLFLDLFSALVNLEDEDPDKTVKYGRELIRQLSNYVKNETFVDIEEAYELLSRVYTLLAKYCFDEYMIAMEWNRPIQKRFYTPRRKVLKVVADDMQDLADGKLDFLSVSLPPRTGKSTLGCFFMSWLMGRYPDLANVMSGHSGLLTKSFHKEVLSLITSEDYRWSYIFPTCRVAKKSMDDLTIDINKDRRFPTLTCRSIGGTLTGAVQVAKCLYCDDMIEDLEEALNIRRLDNKYDAYANQLKDRMLDNGTFILMIGTRWSVHDIQGRIERQYQDNPRYRFRVIPALDEDGNSNFDYPYGLGFSKEYYEDMRRSIDNATWCAKYLGKPYEREGLLFPEDELMYYNGILPSGEPDAIYAACDVAWGGGDNLSMPVVQVFGDAAYLSHVVFSSLDKTVTQPLVESLLEHLKPTHTRFEANNGGEEYAQAVDTALREKGVRLNITTLRAPNTKSKEARILIAAPDIKRMYFLDPKYRDEQYTKFMSELTTYVITGKNPHDDAPDSLAMVVDMMLNGVSRVELTKRFF